MRSVTVIEIFIFQGERGSPCGILSGKVGDGPYRRGGGRTNIGEGKYIFFFFSFEVSKDNITALTYQHRNDQGIALLEILRPLDQTVRSNHPYPLFSLLTISYQPPSRSHRAKIRIDNQQSRDSRKARCHGRSTFHFCYRTIYNISFN
ncbi:hypothetical protein K0M31_009380 [Melipona bicolor]|uniref:Uncharacterized protein n=1 Tax=Melipona bicolor TaxID=60889 RepID=A0AA40FNR0_9HYME|nr:hypothetical protein K0M31_009380 [Melipona bicolor]